MLNRRELIQNVAAFLLGSGCSVLGPKEIGADAVPPMREALFYRKGNGQVVQCHLCPRRCRIGEGKRGFCRNRENRHGNLYSVVYGRPAAVDIGPIEKAPLFHFIPGHSRLCLTCASCNLRCKYCHNWTLSQKSTEELNTFSFSPEQIVQQARNRGLSSISFTYTEPTVYYEYLFDISKLARREGIKTSIVSNGYMNHEPLLNLLAVLDAVKVDLKGFSESFYQEVCAATLKPVLETLKTVKKEKVWLEIVNLVVPTLNDDPKMIDEMCRWIRENLGVETPLHFTRFFPNYKLTHLSPTPISTLETAFEIARNNGLRYIYIGNVPGHIRNSTFCPSCSKRIIYRTHFDVLEMNVVKGKCKFCHQDIQGKWA